MTPQEFVNMKYAQKDEWMTSATDEELETLYQTCRAEQKTNEATLNIIDTKMRNAQSAISRTLTNRKYATA